MQLFKKYLVYLKKIFNFDKNLCLTKKLFMKKIYIFIAFVMISGFIFAQTRQMTTSNLSSTKITSKQVIASQATPNQKGVRIEHTGKAISTNYSKSTLATVPYLETFDAGMPADYVISDLDGNVSHYTFITDAWTVVQLTGFATPAATSTSWYNTTSTSNDWMITTGIQIPATGAFEIKWKGKASDISPYNDSYEVYVTSTIAGSTPVTTDFISPAIFTTAGENNAWTNHSYVLPGTFNGQTIYIAFRNNMYDGNLLSVDDIEVKAYIAHVNEVEVVSTFADFSGMSYYEVTPLSQAGAVDLAGVVLNSGSAAQTNVTLTASDNINSITGTTSLASQASGSQDTLIYTATLDNSTPKSYGFSMNVTQTQTDEVPLNNIGDSIYLYTDNSWYLRSSSVNQYLSTYSFATPIVATTGMEYGCNYHFMNNDQIDSIFVYLYGSNGTGTITAKLYNVDLTTGARTVVAQSAPYTSTGTPWEFVQLALTTPYTVTAPALLTATIQLNVNIAAHDTIKVLADGSFIGDASIGGVASLYDGSTWDWYSFGAVPFVGLINDFGTGIGHNNMTKDVFIYPNPTSNTLYVVNQKANTVEIYNLTGQVIATFNNQNVINVSNLSQGTYFVKVITDSKVITEKINIVR